MADHNDPNAVNSIFSDIDYSAADLYDLFGWPVNDGKSAVIALTFASVPKAGELDPDLLYRILITSHGRLMWSKPDDISASSVLKYFEAVKDKYFGELITSEVRVLPLADGRARVKFSGFPCGNFVEDVPLNQPVEIQASDHSVVKCFIGGRDDAFFNNLTGFFRSINYAPQFYEVPHTMTEARELPIPKTLLELEGNELFNYRADLPTWGFSQKDGHTPKLQLPPGPWTWKGNTYKKDANGNYRFVYDGSDCRAEQNCNAIILELPHTLVTPAPEENRIVNAWGESWVLKASNKVETIADDPSWITAPARKLREAGEDAELKKYKLVDTDGQPFADAALNQREDNRQVGANNFWLGPHFINRLAHLGWGFGPSIATLGLKSSFDHGDEMIPQHRIYDNIFLAFPLVKKVLFQELRLPDDSWNPKGLAIPLRRAFEIFVPNVCAIDMDTTGTWPFGRRLEDQVATRFLAMFLDMSATLNGKPYHIELLNDPALWKSLPIEPKTVPNPMKNDKEFLPDFPYLAEPWPASW